MREKGGMVYGEGEMQYRVRIEHIVPKLVILDTTLWPITKFLKLSKKCGKNIEKIIFPTFDSKTRSQFKSACKKSERNL